MGRPSKLTEKQWLEVERRHLDGESIRSLAKEFGVSESTIRERISAHSKRIIDVANQIVETNQAVKSLSISAQISAHTRAQRLISIQNSLDDAALAGSNVSKRISEAVEKRTKLRTDEELLDSEDMKALMAAGLVSNTHAKLGLDLLNIATKPNLIKSPEDTTKSPVIMTRVIHANRPD